MKWVVNQRMFDFAKDASPHEATEPMLRLAHSIFDGVLGQSLVNENIIQRERKAEDLEQFNKEMRFERVYWQPIQKALLPQTFQLREIDWRSIDLRSSDPRCVGADKATPLLRDLSDKRFKQIVGTGAPSWQTTGYRSCFH